MKRKERGPVAEAPPLASGRLFAQGRGNDGELGSDIVELDGLMVGCLRWHVSGQGPQQKGFGAIVRLGLDADHDPEKKEAAE